MRTSCQSYTRAFIFCLVGCPVCGYIGTYLPRYPNLSDWPGPPPLTSNPTFLDALGTPALHIHGQVQQLAFLPRPISHYIPCPSHTTSTATATWRRTTPGVISIAGDLAPCVFIPFILLYSLLGPDGRSLLHSLWHRNHTLHHRLTRGNTASLHHLFFIPPPSYTLCSLILPPWAWATPSLELQVSCTA